MSTEPTYRYPGIKPFETGDRDTFFGRDADLRRLYNQLRIEQTTVLYSKSGIGKTSLINAGLVPVFTAKSEYMHFVVRAKIYSGMQQQTLAQSVISQIRPEEEWDGVLRRIHHEPDSLWLVFKDLQLRHPNKTFVMIFDQFEEIFSYPEMQIVEFKRQMNDLLYVRIPSEYLAAYDAARAEATDAGTQEAMDLVNAQTNVKIAFAIRRDYLGELNQLSDLLPNIQRSFYELKPLSRNDAREAIVRPAQLDGDFASRKIRFTDEALSRVLDFLSVDGNQTVESFQLQMICQHCERMVIEDRKAEGAEYIIDETKLGRIETLFDDYYATCLDELPGPIRPAVQAFVEDHLLVNDRRISLDAVLCEKLVSRDVLRMLVDFRLLRTEPNSTGGISYEISHDSLVLPIGESKRKRHLFEEELRARRAKFRRRTRMAVAASVVLALFLVFYYQVTKYRFEQMAKTQMHDKFATLGDACYANADYVLAEKLYQFAADVAADSAVSLKLANSRRKLVNMDAYEENVRVGDSLRAREEFLPAAHAYEAAFRLEYNNGKARDRIVSMCRGGIRTISDNPITKAQRNVELGVLEQLLSTYEPAR